MSKAVSSVPVRYPKDPELQALFSCAYEVGYASSPSTPPEMLVLDVLPEEYTQEMETVLLEGIRAGQMDYAWEAI